MTNFFTITTTILITLIICSYLFSGVSIVRVETKDQKTVYYLQWHGADKKTIMITKLADAGRTNDKDIITVNDGEVFADPLLPYYSWAEIEYSERTVYLKSDGEKATLK